MIQIIFLSLLIAFTTQQAPPATQLQTPPGQQFGAFGQLCPNPVAGKVQCETTADIATPTATNPGFLNCARPDDCCLCASIECGSPTDPCDTLMFGPNAAFGVKAINVIGDNIEGASIDCMGSTSCAATHITATAVGELSCAGEYACYSAFVRINSPVAGFGVECPVAGACEQLQIELYFPPPLGAVCDPTTSKDILIGGVECIGSDSCLNLQLIVNNQGCDRVVIETIQCQGDHACTGAIFGFIGDVEVDHCELPAMGPQPFGIEKCFSNLPELSCVGSECQNQVRTLIDPLNNFELLCEGASACLNAQYTIEITTAPSEPVDFLRILCKANNACLNAQFLIASLAPDPVNVAIECIGKGACDGTIFEGGVGIIFDVLCENPLFCEGCRYNGQSCTAGSGVPPNPPIPNGPSVV